MSSHDGWSQADGDKIGDFITNQRYTRRDVLKVSAGLALLATVGPAALSACGSGSGSASSPATSPSSSGPKKGGELRVGLVGASTQDNLDAMIGVTIGMETFVMQLYDQLVLYAPNQKELTYRLAESVEPNSDASVYTVKLKPDLVFHNGKSVTADDVIYSFRRQVDPKNPMPAASLLANVKSMKKLDNLTTRFELDGPCAWFTDALAEWRCGIVPVGYNPKGATGAIGTGPWKVESFVPGTETVFLPNTNYWGSGPYADKLTITAFQDPIAVLNALQSGAVDWVTPLTGTQANVLKSSPGFTAVEAKTGSFICFDMNCTVKPYSDNRVRTAFKLIAGRPQIIDQALGGYGWVANDMPSLYDPGYPQDVPQRTQDLEQARSLLKQAGYDNDLTVVMRTADEVGGGAVEATQVMAQQAKGAGVTAHVLKLPTGQIYGDKFLEWPWAQDIYNTRHYFPQVSYTTLPGAVYNTTHWSDPKWLALVTEANRTVDATKRNELIAESMRIMWEGDGRMIWGCPNVVDGCSTKIAGIVLNNYGHSAVNFDFSTLYFV